MMGGKKKKRKKKKKTKAKKRNKRGGVFKFFDDEVEESDEEEDLNEERERAAEEDKELQEEMARQNLRREREGQFGRESDVKNIVSQIHERYAKFATASRVIEDFEEGGEAGLKGSSRDVVRHAQAPSLTEPRLWIVPCKTGQEMAACISLMNKAVYMARDKQGIPLGISGALCTGLRGFIYVESRTEPAARNAIAGLSLLKSFAIKQVPVTDMVAVVTAGSATGSISKNTKRRSGRYKSGDWVRLNRDKYKGDLARIVAVSDGAETAIVQIIPRVHFISGSASKQKSATNSRPPPRLFSAAEAPESSLERRRFRYHGGNSAAKNWILADELFDVYQGGFYRGGFLYKEINLKTMIKQGEDPKPTLDELERFVVEEDIDDFDDDDDNDDTQNDTDKNLDPATILTKRIRKQQRERKRSLQAEIAALAAGSQALLPTTNQEVNGVDMARREALHLDRGDKVEAIAGDERGLKFIVDHVDARDGIVYCKSLDSSLTQKNDVTLIPIEASRLVKAIVVGAHIKVVDGRYAGTTGLVLECGELDGDHVAVVLTDSGGREITVRLAHVHESNEIAKSLDKLQGFEVHDLLQLPLGSVGVVTRVDRDALIVLTNRNEVRNVAPADIAATLNVESGRNLSLDARDEQVREGDIVIIDHVPNQRSTSLFGGSLGGGGSTLADAGLVKGTEATVIRAHRAFLWLQPTNAASDQLFLIKARNVKLAGQQSNSNGLAANYMGLGTRNVNEEQFNAEDQQGGGNKPFNMKDARKGKDPMLNKYVSIIRGIYKGLSGVVTNITATHGTVELGARNRKVTLPRQDFKLSTTMNLEHETQSLNPIEQFDMKYNFAGIADTPFLNGDTPAHNASQTPNYNVGAATPNYNATPRHTPRHGGGTPHYTPRHGTPSHTPRHGTPSHTPHHTGTDDAIWAVDNSKIPNAGTPRNTESSFISNQFNDKNSPEQTDRANYGANTTAANTDKEYVWCLTGAEVSTVDGRTCRIDNVEDSMVSVTYQNSKETAQIPMTDLRRLPPEEQDDVVVLDNNKLFEAKLLSIEDQDGIIKLADTGEYRIIEFDAISKRAQDGYD
mmetsp:Transcript_15961/g.19432  ORF Transcript_15961/g.19432 Transcript_15961/m.19432 type:complete len:1075 (-) Transcript_15961:371-3595(-)